MITRRSVATTLILFTVLAPLAGAHGDDWPHWRGPNGNGTASSTAVPLATDFTETDIAWKTTLPGTGSSTPAVWGERIFVTCPAEGKDALLCFGLDGREQWRVLFGTETPGKHEKGTGSNPSPLTDGERVYAYYKSGTLAAVDFAGKEIWRANLQEKHGKDTLWWDLGTSPVLAGGRLVVAVLHEGDSFLVAVDPKTGEEVWKTKRVFETTPESDHGTLMFGTVADSDYRFVTEVKVGERVIATPVPVNGKLLVRGAEHLMMLAK